MNDRELLEAAAKAAGIEIHWDEHQRCQRKSAYGWIPWAPLADGHDALALAVKLRLDIKHLDTGAVIQNLNLPSRPYAVENYGANPLSAIRRAIVRAAAEIAKAREA